MLLCVLSPCVANVKENMNALVKVYHSGTTCEIKWGSEYETFEYWFLENLVINLSE